MRPFPSRSHVLQHMILVYLLPTYRLATYRVDEFLPEQCPSAASLHVRRSAALPCTVSSSVSVLRLAWPLYRLGQHDIAASQGMPPFQLTFGVCCLQGGRLQVVSWIGLHCLLGDNFSKPASSLRCLQDDRFLQVRLSPVCSACRVIDFYKTSCGACRYIQPGFVKLCRRSTDDPSVAFFRHNVMDECALAADTADVKRHGSACSCLPSCLLSSPLVCTC